MWEDYQGIPKSLSVNALSESDKTVLQLAADKGNWIDHRLFNDFRSDECLLQTKWKIFTESPNGQNLSMMDFP